jgi:hypothetical protein
LGPHLSRFLIQTLSRTSSLTGVRCHPVVTKLPAMRIVK